MSFLFIALVATAVLTTAAILFAVIRWARAQARSSVEVWRAVADEVGGQHFDAEGPWYKRRPMRIEASVGGVPLIVDSYVVSSGNSQTTYTRVKTDVAAPHEFRIYKEHALSSLGKALGFQDATIGDSAYDDKFIIKSDDPVWLADWLNARFRELHLCHPEVSLQLDGGELTAIRVGLIRDRHELRAQMDVLVACAGTFRR